MLRQGLKKWFRIWDTLHLHDITSIGFSINVAFLNVDILQLVKDVVSYSNFTHYIMHVAQNYKGVCFSTLGNNTHQHILEFIQPYHCFHIAQLRRLINYTYLTLKSHTRIQCATLNISRSLLNIQTHCAQRCLYTSYLTILKDIRIYVCVRTIINKVYLSTMHVK